jgi:hypothetical protein
MAKKNQKIIKTLKKIAEDDPDKAIIVIVEDEERQAGLVVDQLVGRQQVVIKSLGESLKDIPGISGGAIMPDGRVGYLFVGHSEGLSAVRPAVPFILMLPTGKRLSAARVRRGNYESTKLKENHVQNQSVSEHAGHRGQNAQNA